MVPGATWQPDYDLDFVPHGKSKVRAPASPASPWAVIRQATGKDWPSARIWLFDGAPKLGTATEARARRRCWSDGYERTNKVGEVQSERREKLKGGGGRPSAGGPGFSRLDGGKGAPSC